MVFHHLSRRKLASPHMAVPYARHPDIWDERRSTSLGQFSLSYCQLGIVVFSAQSNDGNSMAQRCGSRTFCTSPSPCGIGGVAGRTQRSFKHPFLDADSFLLCSVRKKAGLEKISSGTSFFYTRTYGQANAGNTAVCAVSSGLLAPRPR